MKECGEILETLKSMRNEKNIAGMARFGINPKNTYGVSIPVLRKIAKETGKSHALAEELWASKIHEARILAGMVDDPKKVTERQMDEWVRDFDSWDVCDQVCMNLFDKVPFAFKKALEYSGRENEFERRAGFALMAVLAWHDRKSPDSKFIKFLPAIKKAAHDERNFVKKAVNWALRQIGKRNMALNKKAIESAEEILKNSSKSSHFVRSFQAKGLKSARWIATDAIRELTSDSVKKKLLFSTSADADKTN